MRNLIILFTVVIMLACGFLAVHAEEGMVVINPYVIDEKVKASEQVERMIKIKNETEFKVDLYPVVNDILLEDGKQEFIEPNKLDKSTSLARWIRIQRGVIQLKPGQETEIPLKIEVNLSAIPGKRYAIVSFPDGPNAAAAAEIAKDKATPSILINIEVEDVSVEKAQLVSFKPERNTFFKWPVKFNLSIKNTGTVDLAPKGTITIYNRRDQYLESIDVNEKGEKIGPEEIRDLAIFWDKKQGIGKFKAKLEIEYGNKVKRDLADTIYFWILPLPFVIIFIGGLFLGITILTFYLFRRTYIHHSQTEDLEDDGEVVINLRK